MVPLPETVLKNRFPEYLAVTFSSCVRCQKSQQIFVPSGHFLILERAKTRRALSQVNKVEGPFFVMVFLASNSRILNAPFLRKIVEWSAETKQHQQDINLG
jgi:hypothetical protein